MKVSRRFLTSVFALAVLLFLILAAGAAKNPSVRHWAEEYMEYWAEKGIISGYPEGDLKPNDPVTRAQAASALSRVLGLPDVTDGTSQFNDVPVSHWAYSDITACSCFGIMRGSDGRFRPNDPISREEMSVIFTKAARLMSAEEYPSDVKDWDDVSAWAAEAVASMLSDGLIGTYSDGTLRPGQDMSRGEFFAAMYKVDTGYSWNRFTMYDSLVCVLGDICVYPQIAEGEIYLMLPSFADLTDLHLEFAESSGFRPESISFRGESGEADASPVDVTALSPLDGNGTYDIEITAEDGHGAVNVKLRIMRSSGLPAMFLESGDGTGGRGFIETVKGNSIEGRADLISAEGKIIYSGKLTQIRGRGNSTFWYPKKPYQIKLEKKRDLLGSGRKDKTYVLLSNYAEPTMTRDKICKELARRLGLPGTAECFWVDLFFDGEYRGCYLLSEKIKISSSALPITDLENIYEALNPGYDDMTETGETQNSYGCHVQYVKNITDPPDFSEGYILEASTNEGDKNSWFKTKRGWALNAKSPENLSATAMIYISDLWQEFEDAVYGKDGDGNIIGVNPDTGKDFREYCDLDSFARVYLVYYFSCNQDAYALSTYYYYEDGIFHAGPVWDGDQTFGIGWLAPVPTDSGMRMHYMVEALEEIPAFRQAVARIYRNEFRSLAVGYALPALREYSEMLAVPEAMNHVLWPVYYNTSGRYSAYPAGTTYEDTVSSTEQWMLGRIRFMDLRFRFWGDPAHGRKLLPVIRAAADYGDPFLSH